MEQPSLDQAFKELLKALFDQFLTVFLSGAAEHLDLSRLTFLDKEEFTDLPEGRRREMDLVAEAVTKDGREELILVHVEVQARRDRDFPYRMWEYYSLLRLHHKKPVLPVVLYLSPAGGRTEEVYTEGLFGRNVLTFRYNVIPIRDLPAEEHIESPYALVGALMAYMDPGPLDRARLKAYCLRIAVSSDVDEARQALVTAVIDRRLALSEEENQAFRLLMGEPEFTEVQEMVTSFEQWGIEKGIEKGIEQGRAVGILLGEKRFLLRQMRSKFGPIPDEAAAAVEAIDSEEVLASLADRLLDAETLSDLRLDELDNA